MDPHTHHNKQMMIMNTSLGEGSSGCILLENMASMDHHHQHSSHIFFHDNQQHRHPLSSSLDHHSSSPVWRSFSTDETNNYIVPFSHSNHMIISSPQPSSFSAASSLRFVGSSNYHHVGLLPTNHNNQLVTLDHHHLFSQVLHEEDEQGDDKDEAGGNNDKDLFCTVEVNNEELDEGVDHEEEDEEELSAMKEMMYKIAAMQPVDIDPSTIRKAKRRNVRISDDPQSVAARHRRERISEKMRILQRLVPGGTKMDTASMLDEAIRYVKFLKKQIKHLQQDQNYHPPLDDHHLLPTTTSPFNHQYLTVTMANKQQQQQLVRFVPSPNCGSNVNSALIHHQDHRRDQAEKPLDILNNICSTNNNKLVHQCNVDNNSIVIVQNHQQQMDDIFSQQVISGFVHPR